MRRTTPLQKFVDPLPIPTVLRPANKVKNATYYNVTMRQVKQTLHRDLPPTTVWGYEGSYPGPTIEVEPRENAFVKWINDLPDKHLLPVDKTIHGACATHPEVRTIVHLHGGATPPDSDGYPEAWFTRGFNKTGPWFCREVYHYPNLQLPTTLWYHDHALGITRLNVYAGLAGFYLIRHKMERNLQLPESNYEIPLIIQDRAFNEDGSLFYPRQPAEGDVSPNLPDPSLVPEFFGDTILVNGKVWPYLDVEPRKYRFRLLNGSNARFYTLTLTSGQPFTIIGTDGGFLESPISVREITLSPGERADVILNFSQYTGQQIVLKNSAPTPFPNGTAPEDSTTANVMQFRVNLPLCQPDTSKVPAKLSIIKQPSETKASVTRSLTLVEATDEFGRLKNLLDNKEWMDRISEKPVLGSTQIWQLINLTPDTHPIHLHLVTFFILDSRPFDVGIYQTTGRIVYTGPAKQPPPEQRGLKDTVRVNAGEVTRILATFGPFTGRYVWHCHILEHEDHEMMRPYEVIDPKDYDKYGNTTDRK